MTLKPSVALAILRIASLADTTASSDRHRRGIETHDHRKIFFEVGHQYSFDFYSIRSYRKSSMLLSI